ALRHARLRARRGVRLRPHGGAHARVSGQEDRDLRDEDGGPGHPDSPGTRAPGHGRGGRGARGARHHLQPVGARLQRGALRLLVGEQQQRQRLRRSRRQHALLQRGAGHLHVLRTLRADDPYARTGRLARVQEEGPPGPGHAPHVHAALRRHGGGDRADRGRAHVLPRARAGADRRASDDDGRHPVTAPQGPAWLDRGLLAQASWDALRKLDPRHQLRNPVMFTVLVGSVFTTGLGIQALFGRGEASASFVIAVAAWLWFTLLFANFAEAIAEGRGKAHADALRKARGVSIAKKLPDPANHLGIETIPPTRLPTGDYVIAAAHDVIPCDGEVVEGVASVDESAITGESAPVIRESGGDRSSVTGGTRVLSDWLVIRVTANPGESFLDRMIAMVESAKRHKTPNEIAL